MKTQIQSDKATPRLSTPLKKLIAGVGVTGACLSAKEYHKWQDEQRVNIPAAKAEHAALETLVEASDHLVNELCFTLDDKTCPPGVAAWIALVRTALAAVRKEGGK